MGSKRARTTLFATALWGRQPLLAAIWLGVSLLAGCSKGDDATPDAASDGRAKCQSPGVGGQCMCGPGKNGTTICGEDGYWSTCSCVSLPPGAKCREGEQLRCTNVCPGETSQRTTRCVGGDYDCRCNGGDDAGG